MTPQNPATAATHCLKGYAGHATIPMSGSGTTIKQVGLDAKAPGAYITPSERFTADFADWDRSMLTITSGQSGNFLSPYYLDQFPAWYAGKSFPLVFSDAAVQSVTQHRLTLQPGCSR